MNLVASLCQLAAGGRAVITTIHQARAWGRVVQPDPTLMCLPARARPHASPGPAASLAHPAQGASLPSAAPPAANCAACRQARGPQLLREIDKGELDVRCERAVH